MENSSTDMQRWNTQVRKRQVRICSDRKRKYENGLSDLDVTGKYNTAKPLNQNAGTGSSTEEYE